VCLAYNHEKYIRQCLDGFVMQETNFPFEIIVHEDASTDSTASIIREYEANYPNLFHPIYQTENQYSKKDGSVTRFALGAVRGKYIAMCEGDDYWTDPQKLQKQFDAMELDTSLSFCSHNFRRIYEHRPSEVEINILNEFHYLTNRKSTSIENGFIVDLPTYCKHFDGMHTATLLFRTSTIIPFPSWANGLPSGDYTMKIVSLLHGDAIFLTDNMSVCRKNAGGVTQQARTPIKIFEVQKMQYRTWITAVRSNRRAAKNLYSRLLKLQLLFIFQRNHFKKSASFSRRLMELLNMIKNFADKNLTR